MNLTQVWSKKWQTPPSVSHKDYMYLTFSSPLTHVILVELMAFRRANYELVVTTAMEGLDKSSNSPSLLKRALSFLNQVFTCRASTCSFVFSCSRLLRISAYLVKSFRSGLGFSSYHFLSNGISIEELKTIFLPRRVISIFFPGDDADPSSSCSLLNWECSYQAAKSLIFSDDRRQGYWSLDICDSMPWK